MTQLTSEQLAAAQQASLNLVFGLTGKMIEGIEQLAELNCQAIRSTLEETQAHAQQALSVKKPQDWLTLQTGLAAPIAEKAQTYSRQLFEIASATQAEFARLTQVQCESYGRQVQTLVENAARSAPPGSEAVVAAWSSAMNATGSLLDTLQKSGQQAVEVAKNNMDVAAAAAAETGRRAVESASSAAKP
jgi:phasin family protein